MTEHHIGVQVFGRPVGYDCGVDNIVRNYARQLRSRLENYFLWEGRDELLRLEVPRGGYKPVFVRVTLAPTVSLMSRYSPAIVMRPEVSEPQKSVFGQGTPRWTVLAMSCLAGALLLAVSMLLKTRERPAPVAMSPMHSLSVKLFSKNRNTVIVTADSGFGTLQDVLGQHLSLAEYMSLRLGTQSFGSSDPYIASDLASQRYTSMVDLETAVALSHLPEVVPDRLSIRFARDIRIKDLKDNNVVLLGSAYTNPWAELFEKSLNFEFRGDSVTHTWSIFNLHPAAGESKIYRGERDQASHRTYARIAWVPNLDHSGHVLMLQGLDMAGTQAAAQSLLHSAALAALWRDASACSSPEASFEALLSTTSIGSNSGTFVVLSTRQYC